MVEILARFQTVLVGALGFVGVITTLAVNGVLARRQLRNQRDHDGRVLKTALRIELEALRDSYVSRIENIDKGESDFFVPATTATAVFDRLLDKIGLLSVEDGAAVLKAYALAKELPVRLRLLGGVHEPEISKLGWIPVLAKNANVVRRMHVEFIKAFDEAIQRVTLPAH
jgi:hypothetical protein